MFFIAGKGHLIERLLWKCTICACCQLKETEISDAACLTGPIKGCHRLKFIYKCASKKESKSVPDSIVIQPQGTKALAVPLVTNLSIVRLNLRDNWMEAQGGSAVAELLKENCYITGASLPFAARCWHLCHPPICWPRGANCASSL